jgi:hypothetical protein
MTTEIIATTDTAPTTQKPGLSRRRVVDGAQVAATKVCWLARLSQPSAKIGSAPEEPRAAARTNPHESV